MDGVLATLRERQKAAADSPPPTLADARAGFLPADRRHPIPDDVQVTEVSAGGVRAFWLDAPEAVGDRALLFLHDLGCDGETQARSALLG